MRLRYIKYGILLSAAYFYSSGCGTDSEGAPADPGLVKIGQEAYKTAACITCHTIDGRPFTAPTFKGLYGKEEELADGSKIIVDDAYLRESILDGAAKVVKGYNPLHPPFKSMLTPEQVDGLIAYIKSLK